MPDEELTWCEPCIHWGSLRLEYTREYAEGAAQVSKGTHEPFPCPFNPLVWHLHKKAGPGPRPFSESGP